MVEFDENDKEILQKYTVDQLDLLHDLCGLGEEWKHSERRKELVEIEKRELEILRGVIEDIRIIGPGENRQDDTKA